MTAPATSPVPPPTIVRIPYKPRPGQLELHKAMDSARFVVACCHRRFGKTVAAWNTIQRAAVRKPGIYGFVSPTRTQGKRNVWRMAKFFSAPIPGVVTSEQDMEVRFPNGSVVVFLGADQGVRGQGFHGAVLDEVREIPSAFWQDVMRPALSDHLGWCLFISTFGNDPNFFNERYDYAADTGDPDWRALMFRASQTNVLPQDELRAAKKDMSKAKYAREFECEREEAVEGSYYGDILHDAREEGRITDVPHEPGLRVNTAWDIGMSGSTAIWFWQQSGTQIRFIDYEEGEGDYLRDWAKVIEDKAATRKFRYGRMIAPHDIRVRDWSAEGKSRYEIAKGLGIDFEIAPEIPVNDGIEATRVLLEGPAWFDEKHCKRGISMLRQYHRAQDRVTGAFKSKPAENQIAAHGADALRMAAVSVRKPRAQKKARRKRTRSFMAQ